MSQHTQKQKNTNNGIEHKTNKTCIIYKTSIQTQTTIKQNMQ